MNYVQFYCLAGFLFLFGMVLTYGQVGSFGVEYVTEVMTALVCVGYVSNYLCWSWTSSLIGLLVKVSSFPVNYGVLNIYESVPLCVLFLLVVLTQFYVVVVLSIGGLCYRLTLSYIVLGFLSCFTGSLGVCVETGIARCLGYSTIGNTGFLLLGLGCGSEIFNSYVILWTLCYSIGLFLFGMVNGSIVGYVPIYLSIVSSLVRLDELCGLAYSDSLLGASLSLSVICLMGLTFTLGLLFKYYFWLVSSLLGLGLIMVLSLYSILSSVCY